MTAPEVHPDPDDPTDGSEEEVEPAFAIDMDPDDQGTAEAAAESSG